MALAVEGTATVTDEMIDLHDRIIGKLFNAAKHKHQQQFQASGKAINDKVRLYGRIGQALWRRSKLAATRLRLSNRLFHGRPSRPVLLKRKSLARPEDFDFLIGDQRRLYHCASLCAGISERTQAPSGAGR